MNSPEYSNRQSSCCHAPMWRLHGSVLFACITCGVRQSPDLTPEFSSPLPRDDEATFRTLIPRQVGAFTILEVIAFRAGSPGLYATALVLVDSGCGCYSTHRIICADDRPEGILRWYFEAGHYDFTTRADAWKDMLDRAARQS